MRDLWALHTDTTKPMLLNLEDDFEDNKTIQTALDLASGRERLRVSYSEDTNDQCRRLSTFARKWDSPQIEYIIHLFLLDFVSKEPCFAEDVFITAAIMGDIDLCAKAIECDIEENWDDGWADPDSTWILHGGACMNPSTWDLNRYTMCPTRFTWALQRARQIENSSSTRAELFRSLMEACNSA